MRAIGLPRKNSIGIPLPFRSRHDVISVTREAVSTVPKAIPTPALEAMRANEAASPAPAMEKRTVELPPTRIVGRKRRRRSKK